MVWDMKLAIHDAEVIGYMNGNDSKIDNDHDPLEIASSSGTLKCTHLIKSQ